MTLERGKTCRELISRRGEKVISDQRSAIRDQRQEGNGKGPAHQEATARNQRAGSKRVVGRNSGTVFGLNRVEGGLEEDETPEPFRVGSHLM